MNNISDKIKFLSKTPISNKIFILPTILSFFYNYKLYNENINLKKEKTEMYELCKNAINNQIKYINQIKTQK